METTTSSCLIYINFVSVLHLILPVVLRFEYFIDRKTTEADNRARRESARKPLPSSQNIKIFQEFLQIEHDKLTRHFEGENFDIEYYMRFKYCSYINTTFQQKATT